MEKNSASKKALPLSSDETRLIFIRHGQSMGNFHHLFLGHTDLDLSELGYQQADLACQYVFENYDVAQIYASDLLRAYHTVQPLADRLGITVQKRSELREIYAGDWEGMAFDDIQARYPEAFDIWCKQIENATCTNGESVASLYARITVEAEYLAKSHPGETICMGSHATPIRMLGTLWNGIPFEKAHELPFPTNASVSVAIYKNGKFSRCEKYSFDDFMGDIKTKLKF